MMCQLYCYPQTWTAHLLPTLLDGLHAIGWIAAVCGVAVIFLGVILLIDCAVRVGAQYGANRLPTVRIRIPKHRSEYPASNVVDMDGRRRQVLNAAVRTGGH